MNITVVDKAAWAQARTTRAYLGTKPTANLRSSVGWDTRIGALMPGGNDTWWEVHADEPTSRVAAAVVDAITTWALPEMERRRSPPDGP